MNLPVIFYSLKFWEGLSYILGGADMLLILFNVLPAEYTYSAGAILAAILGALRFFKVNPELRARGLL